MNRGIVLAILSIGTLMAAVDTTIVLLALPSMTISLHTDLYHTIWVLLVYLLVLSVLSTQSGRIGDIVGRSKVYNLGFVIFTLSSLMCGLSSDVYELIAFRFTQAIGGAFLTANSYAIIADYFPPNERGRAYGITSVGWNVGALVGIVLGGVLTTFLGWQYIFFINVPIGAVAVVLGVKNLKDVNTHKSSLDISGTVLLGTSLTLISVGSILIASNGVTMPEVAAILLGIAFLPAFIYNEMKVKNPVINVSLFKEKLLSFSLAASFLQGIGGLSITFLLIMYLQGVRGLSPLDSSLLLTPGYVVASVLAPFMGRFADKGKPGAVAGVGLLFIFASLMIYYFALTPTTPFPEILGITVITGIGSSMFWPSNAAAVMFNAPKQYYGSVSGVSRTLGSIGTALSYVLSITVATLAIPRYVAFEIFLGTNVLDGSVDSTFVNGLHFAFLVSAVIILAASIFSVMGGGTKKETRKNEITVKDRE
ncbi:MFS transporter [Sulfuracidifex tepidarius]|uniref:Multidrug resistance protein MdtD n=1 Tax=Sulfuracidifex tepidarius TaxID=1294262 RepID=A0A510DXG4_9CREN|nr:MFS transporter [Sulfuracidifex tepidarius]BBG24921.1 Putative multidrug resistance protein MdtD [Sulfuracidifex tepidarius]BBG27705.1 Putative multidrug resistance protein MdtD [Sulfuracidifex tepidarius]